MATPLWRLSSLLVCETGKQRSIALAMNRRIVGQASSLSPGASGPNSSAGRMPAETGWKPVLLTEFGVAIRPPPDYTFCMDAPPQSLPPTQPPQQAWARATMWMVIILVLAVNAVIFLKTCSTIPEKTLDKAGQV